YSRLPAAVMLVGFGPAGTASGTMVTASAGVADADQGLVGGVLNTSRQVGAAIGAALLPAVVEAVDHGSRAAARGDRAAMVAAAIAAALATVVACTRATAPLATACATPDRYARPIPSRVTGPPARITLT